MNNERLNLFITDTLERAVDGFNRALHIALDQQWNFLDGTFLQIAHHLFQRSLRTHTGSANIAMLALSGRSDVGLAGEGVIATAQCGVYVNEDKNLITRIGVRERRVAFNNQFAHLRDASTFDLPFAEASIDYRIEGSADRGVLIRRERGCQPVRLTKACMGDIVIDQSWAGFYRDDQHHWAVELRSDGSGFAMTFAPRWSGALTMLLRPVSSVQFEVTDRGGTPHWGASVLLSERSGVRELSLSTPRTFDFRFMNREGASC